MTTAASFVTVSSSVGSRAPRLTYLRSLVLAFLGCFYSFEVKRLCSKHYYNLGCLASLHSALK